jgi:hypothetical protein
MTKHYNPQQRTAKLVELVNEDLTSNYKFKDSSIDFRNPAGEKGSNLVYLTHSNNLDEKDVKNVAMKTFEDNYNGIFDFYYKNKSFEELKEMKEDTKNTSEQLKAKNFYNPRKFNQSPGNFKMSKSLAGMMAGMGAGCFLVGADFTGGMVALGGTGALEFSRRINLKDSRKELESINQNIEYYDNFKRNIENSDVNIIPIEEAKEIYNELPKSKGTGRFVKLDFDSVNQELIDVYNKH